MSNIAEVVNAEQNMNSLMKAMKVSGLYEVLIKKGPFTVFAPTDFAFRNLKAGEWPELLRPDNRVKLAGILSNYVVEGKTNFKDLTDGQKLRTLGGRELEVTVNDGNVDIDGERIQGRDMEASNGVVHSLDKLRTN